MSTEAIVSIILVCLLLAVMNAMEGNWGVAIGNLVGLAVVLLIAWKFRKLR